MPCHTQPTSHSCRWAFLTALCLAVMTTGCSEPASPEGAEERIRPVARFEMEGAAAPEAAASTENDATTTEEAATATEEATSATEEAAPAPAPAPVAAPGKDGATVYAQLCKTCHDLGISGAPKTGDVAAWEPRIAAGMETLYQSSLKGKNVMPPKGGNMSLSDDEVKSAVDFMVAASR